MMTLHWNDLALTATSPLGETKEIYWSEINKIEVSVAKTVPYKICHINFYFLRQARIIIPVDMINVEPLYEFSEGIRKALGDGCYSDWITPLQMMETDFPPLLVWSKQENEESISDLFQALYVKNWEEAKQIAKCNSGYVFRGHSVVHWPLSTSIERAFDRSHKKSETVRKALAPSCESDMLYEFKRKALLYEQNLPSNDNLLEWLSLLQHYGCPTRLLDFTKSFYVAAFFAIANASRDEDITIWAISRYGLTNCVKKHLGDVTREKDLENNRDAVEVFNNVVSNGLQFSGLMLLEPEQLNERISVQQGLFAAPLDIRKTFEENLLSLVDKTGSIKSIDQLLTSNTKQYKPKENGVATLDLDNMVTKIIIPQLEIPVIRRDLKQMNITYETLFPGLEGYARSLENLIYH